MYLILYNAPDEEAVRQGAKAVDTLIDGDRKLFNKTTSWMIYMYIGFGVEFGLQLIRNSSML